MKPSPKDASATPRETGPKSNPHTSTSKDGRWRTFQKHSGLMQFVPAGTYYARVKVRGKSVRAALETAVFTTAKLRLPDKIKALRKSPAEIVSFADGRLKYVAGTQNDHTLAPLSKIYRLRCVECPPRPGPAWTN